MQNKNTSSVYKNKNRFPHGFGRFLFSEAMGIRLFRILTMFIAIAGWGIAGTLMFEADKSGLTISNVLRYSLAPIAAIAAVFFLGVQYLQDIYELPSYFSAMRYLFAIMFDGPPYNFLLLSGLSLPFLNVSNGKVDATNNSNNILERIGGPGWLSVEAGNVVLLEYLHSPARVLGPGFHFVPRMQHVAEIYSLEDQRWMAAPIVATTKDGIEVAVYDFQFGYRLATPSFGTVKRTNSDPYPFSAKAVLKLTYNRSVREDGKPMEWGKTIQFRLDGIVTDFINRNSIDEIIAPIVGDPRETILNKLSSINLRNAAKENLGTEVTWVNIGRFDINDEKIGKDIKDYRLNAWFAQWTGKAALIRAEGKAEQISQTEGGRIEKTTSMLRGILQALKDVNLGGNVDDHMWNIVLARTAQIIESMTSLYGTDILDAENESRKKGLL